MENFLKLCEDKLSLVRDGQWHINEIIAAAIVIVLLALIIAIIVDIIRKIANRQKKQTAIFSNKKNPYKTKIRKYKRQNKKNKYK